MKCPRCRLSLKTVDYEGVDADICEACWGFWLDKGELETVILNTEFKFSEEEKAAVLDISKASDKGPTKPAACPRCNKTMKRVHYDDLVHLVVDRCDDHGIWLDTGEIKKVQALASRSKAIHTMLLRKLGLVSKD
jgi:Zn-finger nucleic acid-binding protein